MKSQAHSGMTGEIRFVVEPKHTIDFATDGMPAVLCTPWLVWFLEHAARATVLPLLEAGESTVGTEIEVRHLAPTPIGHQVVCQARVLHADGPRITFQLEARDETELIARAFHRLHVIRVPGFAQRVARKAVSATPPPTA